MVSPGSNGTVPDTTTISGGTPERRASEYPPRPTRKAAAAVDQAGPKSARVINVNTSDPSAPTTAIGSNDRSGEYEANAKATDISAPEETMIGRLASWIVCTSIASGRPSLIPTVMPRL